MSGLGLSKPEAHRHGWDTAPPLPHEVRLVVADEKRLAVVRNLLARREDADADFERLAALTAPLLDSPIVLVTLLDQSRQFFLARLGIGYAETPIELSFCAHAIASDDGLAIVEDATADPRFMKNPLVTGEEQLRFYAGMSIAVSGARVGTLCVLDRVARPPLSPAQQERLKALAKLAASLFELKEGDRKAAATRQALAREESRRALAVEAAGLASWVWNVRTNEVECDELLSQMFNLPRARRISGRHVLASIDRRDVNEMEMRFRDALSRGDDYVGEYRVRNTEPPRWLAARGRVVERDSEGQPILVFGVNYDVSERRANEERQRLLLRELNHRVRNTLATVQALASQTVRHARDPTAFLSAFSARLQALGDAHELLSNNEWRGISLAELVRRELRPFDDEARSRVLVDGEDTLLLPDQALGIGVVLHELASNAIKHGALSWPSGRVALNWRVEGTGDQRRLLLDWRESGGPAVKPPERHGFGTILIRRSLAKVLSSEVRHDFLAEGVAATISVPLSQATV